MTIKIEKKYQITARCHLLIVNGSIPKSDISRMVGAYSLAPGVVIKAIQQKLSKQKKYAAITINICARAPRRQKFFISLRSIPLAFRIKEKLGVDKLIGVSLSDQQIAELATETLDAITVPLKRSITQAELLKMRIKQIKASLSSYMVTAVTTQDNDNK